jgi:hypothetical protein
MRNTNSLSRMRRAPRRRSEPVMAGAEAYRSLTTTWRRGDRPPGFLRKSGCLFLFKRMQQDFNSD